MARKPLVFSFINEQKRFLFVLVSVLTFLIITSGGLVLSVSNAIGKFRSTLDRSGMIMISNAGNIEAALKIISDNKKEIIKVKTIDKSDAAVVLKKWLSNTDALENYIPTIVQVETVTAAGLGKIAKRMEENKNLRFVYSRNATPDRSIGIKIILLSGFIFIVIAFALAACIVHSVKNIILIHEREIGILNQIGATNSYIVKQLQSAILEQTTIGTGAGLVSAWLILILINGLSAITQVGLLSNMGLWMADWFITGALALLVIAGCAWITRQTALKILAK